MEILFFFQNLKSILTEISIFESFSKIRKFFKSEEFLILNSYSIDLPTI